MLTITRDLVLPCTVTGSWPRPRWYDVSLWGRPLDTCMLDVRFREKFQDALDHGDRRRGARRPRPAHARRPALRRRHGRPRLASLPAAALGRLRRRPAAVRGDALAVAALPAGHAAERDLHGLALAARGRQGRAPPARLPEDLAAGAGAHREARALRHLLLAGDGPVPRPPHPEVQGQARGALGHGGGHEPGAAARCATPAAGASRSRSRRCTSGPTPTERRATR